MPLKRISALLLVSCLIALMAYPTDAQISTSLTTYTESSTLTSANTYAIRTTQFTTTITSTIYDGTFPLSSWGRSGCSATLPFNAKPGDEITINFKSDTPIDFHIVWSIYPGVDGTLYCGLGGYASSLSDANYQTSYSIKWSPPIDHYKVTNNTQFYIVLADRQATVASVSLTARETLSQMASSTIYATTTTLLTLFATRTLSTITTLTPAAYPSGNITATTWIILLVILLGLAAVLYLIKRKKPKPEKTQIY